MKSTQVQPATRGQLDLSDRLRAADVLWLECDARGSIIRWPWPAGDWEASIFSRGALFRKSLRRAVQDFKDSAEPDPVEVIPGCWIIGSPIMHRRRCSGWGIGLVITDEFTRSEQFQSLCHAAELDVAITRHLLMEVRRPAACEVPRIATLVRILHQQDMSHSRSRNDVEEMGRHLSASYEEMHLLYTVISSMSFNEKPSVFLAGAATELLDTTPFCWGGVILNDDIINLADDRARLLQVGDGHPGDDVFEDLGLQLLATADSMEPLIIDPSRDSDFERFSTIGGPILACPIRREDKLLGMLVTVDKDGEDASVSSIETKLVGATADHMGIFLENAMLYQDLDAMFLGMLQAITSTIDAKDPYTRGHSQRVALLSRDLAHAIGLSEEEVKRVHIAGLVHDVGKIGIPEAVLCKPGQLTDQEYRLVQEHPEIGYRILKDIPQLRDVLTGVLHHHERWDGAGYPSGLAGRQIPLFARLIALADTFDAMSSDRTYRGGRSRDEVLAEISRCRGAQFDPEFVDAFCQLDFTEFDRLISQAQEGTEHDPSGLFEGSRS
ncbi:MAG: hypothetical protein CMJ32_10485 [Phycisphaerae bacterium]|nr:hypothetical protein [Phycisphaerae bacterium]